MQTGLIETQRLLLRPITPEVYSKIFKLDDDEIRDFFGLEDDEELKRERARWEAGLNTFNKSFYYFQLIDKDSGVIMGWCGYHTWYKDHDRAEIGYTLSKDEFKQNGFMAEALEPIIEFGFNRLKLHRIEALVGPNNIPSLKLMDRFGFTQEGHLKQHYLRNGIYEDSLVFAKFKNS